MLSRSNFAVVAGHGPPSIAIIVLSVWTQRELKGLSYVPSGFKILALRIMAIISVLRGSAVNWGGDAFLDSHV